jgi:hypothetical protein
MSLYTKDGIPLKEKGDIIYSSSGKVVGKKKGNKVYGTNGQYVGTIVGNRLTYRHEHSSSVSSTFSASNIGGTGKGNIGGSGMSGSEPKIPK